MIYLRIVISINLLEAPDEIPRGLVKVLVPLGDAKRNVA
jgi:ACT domain-containing protein